MVLKAFYRITHAALLFTLLFCSLVIGACVSGSNTGKMNEPHPPVQPSPSPVSQPVTQSNKQSPVPTTKKEKPASKKSKGIPFETLELGWSGWLEDSDQQPIWFFINNQEKLTQIWTSLHAANQPVPLIDFKTASIILVHSSERNNCCSIRIDSIEPTSTSKDGTDVVLKLINSVPGNNCPSGDALSGSIHTVTIPAKYRIKKVSISVEVERHGPDCSE